MSTRKYDYTKLKDARYQTCINVYGIVKFFKPPARCRGTDYIMTVSLTDPSFLHEEDKLKCVLFGRNPSDLPDIKEVGDIVRFHRLFIKEFNEEPQGSAGKGFSWLVFSGSPTEQLVPRASSGQNYTLDENDKVKVKELIKWKSEELDLSQDANQRILKLSSTECKRYFDLTCQVVSTCILSPSAILLRIWDGTKINLPVMVEDTSSFEVKIDPTLQRKSQGYVYDVKVFDDHCTAASRVQPGDFVLLRNLHAAQYKPTESGQDYNILPTIEFCLHRGSTYNRGLSILSPTSDELKNLQQTLQDIPTPPEVTNPQSPEDTSCLSVQSVSVAGLGSQSQHRDLNGGDDLSLDTQGQRQNESELSVEMFDIEDELENRKEDISTNNHNIDNLDEANSTQNATQDDDRRCMQVNATMIKGHHNIKTSHLKDVTLGRVPYKYRVRVKIRDLQPKADCVEEFLRLYCSNCHYVNTISGMKKKPVRTFKGIDYYSCPVCVLNSSVEDKENECASKESGCELEYIYMLQFMAQDASDWLVLQLWREQAVTFFNGIEPASLLQNKYSFQRIQKYLKNLLSSSADNSLSIQPHSSRTQNMTTTWAELRSKDCSTKDILKSNDHPWVECCVKAYNTEVGVCYQMFDTILCMEDLSQ